MNFNEGILTRHRDDLNSKGVRIRFAGRRDWRVPRRLSGHMDESMELTAREPQMTLTICFNYGGRAEIVDAVRQLVADGVPAGKIDEQAIRSRLYWPDMPDPDVVMRTSGEFRISNFLLWELRLLRARVHRRALARLPPGEPLRRRRRVPAPGPALRRGATVSEDSASRFGSATTSGSSRDCFSGFVAVRVRPAPGDHGLRAGDHACSSASPSSSALIALGTRLRGLGGHLPGRGRRAADDAPRGGRPDRHLRHARARQGPGGRQGDPQDQEPPRRPARAADLRDGDVLAGT